MSYDNFPKKYFMYAITSLCVVIIKLFAWGNAKEVELQKAHADMIALYREVMKLEVNKAKNQSLKKLDSL